MCVLCVGVPALEETYVRRHLDAPSQAQGAGVSFSLGVDVTLGAGGRDPCAIGRRLLSHAGDTGRTDANAPPHGRVCVVALAATILKCTMCLF